MAKRITDLPELTSADTNDLIPLVDVSGNVTKRVTLAGIAAAVASVIPNGAIKSAMLGLSKTADTKGWVVKDYGTWKEYSKVVSRAGLTASVPGHSGFVVDTVEPPEGFTNFSTFEISAGYVTHEPHFIATLSSRDSSGTPQDPNATTTTRLRLDIRNVSPSSQNLVSLQITVRLRPKT